MRVLFLAALVAACAAAAPIGPGCDTYRDQRLAMPEISAEGAFLDWFLVLDARMLEACRP